MLVLIVVLVVAVALIVLWTARLVRKRRNGGPGLPPR
jgi:hypothetical protein